MSTRDLVELYEKTIRDLSADLDFLQGDMWAKTDNSPDLTKERVGQKMALKAKYEDLLSSLQRGQ